MSTRRTLTVIISRTISRTFENTSKTSGPSGSIWRSVTTAENVGVVPSIPRRTNQQQHRDNVPAQTSSDYCKRAVAIPFLDHLQSEMKTNFNPTNDAVLSSLFNLLPELEFYESDLPYPHVVDVELLR